MHFPSSKFGSLVLVVVGLLCAPPARGERALPRAFAGGQVSKAAQAAVDKACLGLRGSANGCRGSYDYFPKGGLRNFYCHVKDRLDLAKVAKLSRVPIFSSGPHRGGQLVLDSTKSFGRYNPAFVRWLRAATPGVGAAAVRRLVQPVYDKSIKPLARIFYLTYRKLTANATYLQREQKHYLSLVASGQTAGYYEKFFYFMSPTFYAGGRRGFDGGVDGNVTKTCVAFWIRRSIDGTAGLFFAGLKKLLEIYDAGFLRAAKTVSPAQGNHAALLKR